jgi:hypothetical protein
MHSRVRAFYAVFAPLEYSRLFDKMLRDDLDVKTREDATRAQEHQRLQERTQKRRALLAMCRKARRARAAAQQSDARNLGTASSDVDVVNAASPAAPRLPLGLPSPASYTGPTAGSADESTTVPDAPTTRTLAPVQAQDVAEMRAKFHRAGVRLRAWDAAVAAGADSADGAAAPPPTGFASRSAPVSPAQKNQHATQWSSSSAVSKPERFPRARKEARASRTAPWCRRCASMQQPPARLSGTALAEGTTPDRAPVGGNAATKHQPLGPHCTELLPLLMSMLHPDPARRPSAAQLLLDPWFACPSSHWPLR